MLHLLLALASATDLESTTLGALRMPLTPSEGHPSYMGVFEHAGAGAKTWQSDSPGFTCRGNVDLLEIVVEEASWPVEVPKKVTCLASDGKKVKARTEIVAKRHVAMFVAGGTLILPRDAGTAVIYDGPSPHPDVVVQQGKTGSLAIRCEVRPGPVLRVIVEPEAKDGSGQCVLKDNHGEVVRVPMKIVTAP